MKKKILSGILALTMLSGLTVVPAFAADAPAAAEISQYDTLIAEHKCEESTLTALSGQNSNKNDMDPATIEEGAPDGSKYVKTGNCGNEKYGTYCFESEFSYGSNTKEDVMFVLDIRFDQEGSGFTPRDKGDSKSAGTVLLRNGTIQVQKGSGANDYTDSKISADTTSWYNIALVGRFSASDANVDMYVWKYGESGNKEYLGIMKTIPLRTLGASQNNGVSHLNVNANTSVDNLKVYKLGADALSLNSTGDSIKAGESMLFTYSATRAGEYITNPAVTWEVYNEADDAVLEDENISISTSGLLTIGGNAAKQTIHVRATTESGVYASKEIEIDAIDTSTDTYDSVTLSAQGDKNTVRLGEPLEITAITTKNGEEVDPGEGDLLWKVCNAGNLRELGNKNITITDGTLSVTEDAVPQTVTVKAVNKSGSVSGTYEVQVLPANMNYGNEDEYTDTFESADACEEYISGAALTEGSWDGSAYYNVTAAYDFIGFSANTTADVIYSADMQFANDGAGWTVYNSSKGKLGLQLSSSGTVLNAVGASNSTTKLMDIDKNAWYNIQVMCATGNSSSGTSYARFIAYKYDENGNKVNPKTGEKDVPLISSDIKLRNLDESSANHINISAGTHVDNVMNIYVAPDKLTINLDAQTVLAGGSAQATATASRKGVDFPFLSTSLIKYEIYDADDAYPLGSNLITIDPSGKLSVDPMADAQDIYVRVTSTSGGMHDSAKVTIKSSDIFEITGAGFVDEEYSVLKRIDITKNFDYKDDVSFITAVYGADGAMKTVKFKKAYGDQLSLGSNRVVMDMAMPADFDTANDKLNAFAVTKLPVSKAVESDGTLTVSKNTAGITLNTVPEFSDKVVILVLKTDDPTKVEQGDIVYFNQVSADAIPTEIKINGDYDGDYLVEIAGKINGVHTVKSASTKSN